MVRIKSEIYGLFLLVLMMMLSLPLQAKIIYVSPAGDNNNNDQTEAKPLKDIAKAISLATVNDTIKLLPGTYSVTEPVVLPIQINLLGNLEDSTQIIIKYTGTTFAEKVLDMRSSIWDSVQYGNQFLKGITIDGRKF